MHERLIESSRQKNRDVRQKILRKKSVDEDVVDKFSTFTPEISKFRVMSRKFTAEKRFRMSPFALVYDLTSGFNDF